MKADNCKHDYVDQYETMYTDIYGKKCKKCAFVYYEKGEKTVCVDACISHVIKHIWNNGVFTKGSCCGHNGKYGKPSIILDSSIKNADKVRKLISEVDERDFKLMSWNLIEV